MLAAMTVTTLSDSVDFDDGKLSLREAIFAANTFPGADEIDFDAQLFATGAQTIVLQYGALQISDALTIVGPGADMLTIDASGNDPTPGVIDSAGDSIFTVFTPARYVTTIAGMKLTGADSKRHGGAISAASDVHLYQLVITGNAAARFSGSGGGVYASQSLTIEECAITNNSAGGPGGGVWAGGATIIRSSQISGNTITGSNQRGGGGIYAGSLSSEISIEYSEINGNRATNSAAQGAGIWIAREMQATISASIVSDNSTPGNGGGVSSAARNLRILDTLIAGNTANRGGGVYGQFAEFTRSTATDNVAEFGGGMYQAPTNSLRFDIRSSTISGNMARDSGGGLWVTSTPIIQHSTITDNRADSDGNGVGTGGGVHGRAGLEHTILAGNFVGTGADLSDADNTVAAYFSLIGVNNATGLAEAPLGAPDANGNLIGGPVHGPIDPLLAPLADNGGFLALPTHALLPGSPALDAGDPLAIAGGWNTPLFDQRDTPYSRVIGRIDIGAVEQIPDTLVVDTLLDESDERYHRGDLSLREAIELANRAPGHQTIIFDPALFASGPGTILLTLGELWITDSLTLTGPGAELLAIDASGSDPTPGANNWDGVRVFTIDDGDASTRQHITISSVTIRGGEDEHAGGGIHSRENLTVIDAIIRDNTTSNYRAFTRQSDGGGGIYIESANLHLLRTKVLNNYVAHGHGAGVSVVRGAALIEESVIAGNHGVVSSGGGVYFATSHSAVIRSTEIANNYAYTGGGIRTSGGTIEILGSTIRGN